VSRPRFFDSTTEDLEPDVLRPDDPGVETLVFDPKGHGFHWEKIPFQEPGANTQAIRSQLTLGEDGTLKGTQAFAARGYLGQALRHSARNSEAFSKYVQALAGLTISGATAGSPTKVETSSLRRPAAFSVAVSSDTAVRWEDGKMRLRLPELKTYDHGFSLESRKYPLLMAVPTVHEWHSDIALPKGARVEHLPSAAKVEAACFTFERTTREKAGTVSSDARLTLRCERISPDAYPEHRVKAQRVQQLLTEELVVRPKAQSPKQRPLAKESP
jgi:hypothetical protein